jgi:MraZ protein
VGQSGTPEQSVPAMLIKCPVEHMFLGEYQHALDDKSRLTIPAKFRDELAKGCVVTRGFEKNLIIYSQEDFEVVMANTQSMSLTDPDARALQRLIYSGANQASLDKNGRVIVPPFLKTYAGIDSDVYIIGVGKYIEVWSKAGWEEQLQLVNDPEVNSRRFAALNLSTTTGS